MASNTPDNATLTQGAPTIGVGQTLKTAREVMGKDIAAVAVQLRIRQPFLQALEDGRHKDLPGGTYAIGFLRTYAEFLSLDGEEMVRRFRAEAAGELDARSELVFPSPVSEGRIPGGAVLFLGLLLAGVAYGAWYWLSSRQASVAEIVPPLPDRLASVFNRPATLTGEAAKPAEAPKPDETPAKLAEESPAPAAPPPAAKDNEVVPPSEGEDDSAKNTQHAVAPASAPVAPVPAAPEPAKAEPMKAEPSKPAPGKPEALRPEAPKPEAAKADAPKPAEPSPAPAAAATPTETKAPEPTPASIAAPAHAPEGKVIGQDNADSRIQLKASGDDCWLQVRELDGQLLMSRLLRRGDSYMVPNRPGLTLMVGNAGALDVTVDGKRAPALGNTGQVRRDIKLDPDKLLGGG